MDYLQASGKVGDKKATHNVKICAEKWTKTERKCSLVKALTSSQAYGFTSLHLNKVVDSTSCRGYKFTS